MPEKSTANELQRGLKARHLTMISIGGSIGTGLFLASGTSIYTAGPGGALLAYTIIGVMVYLLMTSLGEMASYMPVSGSFSTYASKFADPALGFALGWNYWFSWAITLAVETSAAAILMKYWLPDSSSLMWNVLFLLLIVGLNLMPVKKYGEAEYWFAMIKVAAIVVFIITGLLMIFGILTGETSGLSGFTAGDAPFHGGILAVLGIMMIAGFSFQGTEIVGIVAGESDNPKKNIPIAVKQIFWRILLFYMLAIFVIAMIIPFTDERLMGGGLSNMAMSPFTLVFERAGIAFAASVMNAVILTSVLSAGNSGLYAATRMLYVMAKEKKAPAFLTRINKNGVPIFALLLTGLIGMLAFMSSLYSEETVFLWLLNASGLTGFIAWMGIAVSHYRFRKGYLAQGNRLEDLPYKAKWYPLGPIMAGTLCLFIILGQNYQAFIGGPIDWYGILVTYIGLPIFIGTWICYKLFHKTKWVKLQKMDLSQ
ncbi:amino acid permease [Bacillus mangrovi]|uniref:Amino acid permease n=1 Tax=Metabacillus mangrovi TaxID=1491830 RepID=A0A7X2S4F1_9BACI|nr:amino acid permease [Metabacillus mangrovi]MTH53432.1 amino acid permease [Metabacillus mangrovi]